MSRLADLMDRVLQRVELNRDAIIADVASCVRIPNIVGHEGLAQDYMRSLYEGLGLEIDIFVVYEALVALDIERAERWRDPFFGALSDRAVNLNIGALRAGDWPSTVAGRAEMDCRIAFIPPQTIPDVRREVEARIAEVAASDSWLRDHPPTVEWFGWQAEPWRQDATHPFVSTLAEVTELVAGTPPPLAAATGGLNARHAAHFGMPAACVGAWGDGMHAADEFVTIDSVIEAAKIYAGTIVSWCGVTDGQ